MQIACFIATDITNLAVSVMSSSSCPVATPGIPPRELGPVCAECSVQDILANCWHLLSVLCWVRGLEGEAVVMYAC